MTGDDYLRERMEAIMRAPWEGPTLDRPVEPKLAGPGPQGKADDAGRGDLSARQQAKLEALRWSWQRGDAD